MALSYPQPADGQARPSFWQRLRHWLIDPPASVEEPGERRQAQILAGLALVMALSTLASLLAPRVSATAGATRALVLVSGLGVLAYGLARTRYYSLGAWLLTLSIAAAAGVDILAGSDNPSGALFSFIPLALVVAAAFLRPRSLLVLTVLLTAGSFYLSTRVADFAEANRVVGAAGVNATVGLLLAIGGAVQRAVERERRNVLTKANADLTALRESLEVRVHERTRALSQAQTRAEGLLRQANAATRIARLASFDLDWTLQTVTLSDGFYALLGTTAGAHGGYEMPLTVAAERFIHPEDGARVLDEIRREIDAGRDDIQFTARFVRAEGQTLVMDLHFQVERNPDGRARRARGAVQDITERRRTEEELLRFRYSLERSTDAIFMTDPQGVIQYVNPAFEKTYGYSAVEALGQTPRLLKSGLIPGEQYTAFWQTLLNKQVVAGEIINKTKDGRLIPVEGANTPILNREGQIIGFMAAHRDISERKQAQAALAKRAAELEITTRLATSIARITDLDVMLQTVVDEVKTSFNLYHAHIYLLNPAGDQLLLSAGAGEAGRQMLAQKRTILLNHPHSLVARAARSHQGVVANDVTREPDFLPHPLLPETRSELAVPLLAADTVLGVLDVQSDTVDHFTPEDVGIQTILAAQIAVALENAQSRRQSEQALRELDALTRRLTREGWQQYTEQKRAAALRYVFSGDTLLTTSAAGAVAAEAAVVRPIQMRGETVGQVAAAGADRIEPAEVAAILEAVAAGLSTHLDNLRLSEQTQQALAQTETLYTVTSQVSNAADLQAVLKALLQPAIGAGAACGHLVTFELDEAGQPQRVMPAASWQWNGSASPMLGAGRPAAAWPLLTLDPTQPTLVSAVAAEARLPGDARAYLTQLGAAAAAVLPLAIGGRCIGQVIIGWPERRSFSEAETRLYESLAAQAAVVVNNRLLFEQTRRRADREAVINAISQKIQGTTSVRGALATAIQELGEALKARRAAVALTLEATAEAANGHGDPPPAGSES